MTIHVLHVWSQHAPAIYLVEPQCPKRLGPQNYAHVVWQSKQILHGDKTRRG